MSVEDFVQFSASSSLQFVFLVRFTAVARVYCICTCRRRPLLMFGIIRIEHLEAEVFALVLYDV